MTWVCCKGFHSHRCAASSRRVFKRVAGQGTGSQCLPEDMASSDRWESVWDLEKPCGRVFNTHFLLGPALTLMCKGSQH